jgi:hypothetical protein
MRLLFSYYQHCVAKLELLAIEFGFTRVDLRIAKIYKWRLPGSPFRVYISVQELARWVQCLDRLLEDEMYRLRMFIKARKVAREWKP